MEDYSDGDEVVLFEVGVNDVVDPDLHVGNVVAIGVDLQDPGIAKRRARSSFINQLPRNIGQMVMKSS